MRDEPMSHSFTPGRSEGTTVLKLVGPLTISTMFGFQNELRSTTPQVLIVDLSEVPYMDSAGLGLIMNSHVSALDHGRKLILAGVNERILALFDMTKVKSVLTRFATVEEAEASL
jgi:anti-sigma B factor antagonist